ncbi:MAG: outer membrane protein assembly factor BamA [Candidatus Hydrogenedentes bacterium]|nr:outer membrane protein assembly factor BamA [Candidatus Hydrogenedentota bacterium]
MRKFKFWLIVALLSILETFTPLSVVRAQYEGRPIKEVRVTGNRLVSDQQILSRIETKPGDLVHKGAIRRDIKRIFKLGHFKTILVDVTEVEGGVTVGFIVSEKGRVGEIRVMGHTKVKEKDIKDAISLRIGESYDSSALGDDAETIRKLYEKKGFSNAKVYIDVEEIATSRVRLTYSITEGRKARIRAINIEGNTVFTDAEIRKRMSTRTAKLRFIGGIYDEEKFQEDLQLITAVYEEKGYVESRITDTSFDYSPNGKSMFITVRLDEGSQYHVASVQLQGNEIFGDDEIISLLRLKQEDVFNRAQVARDGAAVSVFYSDAGYIYAAVHPQVTLDREKKVSHILLSIREGELIYLGQIEITNNVKTKDEVIRRELTIYPGERFDAKKIRRSVEKVRNLGFFEEQRPPELSTRPSELPGVEDLLINVTEKETGALYFGAGYSSDQALVGSLSLDLWNVDIANPPKFTGAGQRLRLGLQSGRLREMYSLSFTDPYFLGYPLLFGVDIFKDRREFIHHNDFSEDRVGAGFRFGKRLSEYVRSSLGLRYDEIEIGDIGIDVTQEIWKEQGTRSTASIIWVVERNSLDYILDPRTGTVNRGTLEVAGAGAVADTDFIKLDQDYSRYFPLSDKWVLSVHETAGYVTEYGRSDRVPIFERFFVGGTSSVRGYDERDIGPKSDDIFHDPIGGNVRLVTNLEISYAITDILRGYIFTDSGTAWLDIEDADLSDMKYSAGLGIGIRTPIGPLRVDYGVPINPDTDQGSGRIHFRVGLGRFLF